MTQTTLSNSDIIQTAIERLREHEPEEGYYLAFSGGKDSICCHKLCEMAGVKFTAHYSMTTIDPPSITKFIRENYPDVIWERPYYKGKRTNYYDLISKKGLPNRQVRWCCSYLKEINGEKGSTVVLGVRRSESVKRANRDVYSTHNGKHILNPIVDWKDTDVWEFIKTQKLSYPSLYDEGQKRAGCIMCPLSCREARVRDYQSYPAHVRAIEKAVASFLRERERESGLLNWGNNPYEIVYYWVHDSPIESAKGPCLSAFLRGDVE